MNALVGLLRRRTRPPAEKPLRDELLSIERLEERARALAARFTLDPNPRRASRNVLPRFEDNARVLREAYVTLADDVHRGRVRHPRGGVAPRQLPPRGLRDPRRPPQPPARLLPRAAQARPARAGGPRPRLRPGRRAHPPQRQPPGPPAARALHEQLPDRGPADDRRAVGLAEHAQAGPHREPAAARGGDARGPRGASGGRRLRGADRRRRPREAAAAAGSASIPATSSSSSQRLREYGPRLSAVRAAVDDAPRRPADDLRGRDPERASAPGRGPGLGGERHHQPPPLLRRSTGASTSRPSA